MKNMRIHSWLISISLFASLIFLSQCQKPDITDSLSSANKTTSILTKAAITPEITSFVHPGVLNTQASLDLVASQVNGGDAYTHYNVASL